MNHIGTLWEYIYILQVVSFLVFGVSLVRKTSKMHPWSSDAIFSTLHAPHDVISVKMMPPSGVAHLQLHCDNI